MRITTQEILPGLRNGESWAYEILINQYKKLLITSVLKHFLKYNDFDDVFINIISKVYTNIHQYKPEYSIFTWMRRIAQTECIDFLNKKDNRTWGKFNHIEDYSPHYIDYTVYTETVFDKYEDLRVALEKLPPDEKDIIDKFYLKGWCSGDIADEHNVASQTIRNKIPKILSKLKENLHEEAKGYSKMVS